MVLSSSAPNTSTLSPMPPTPTATSNPARPQANSSSSPEHLLQPLTIEIMLNPHHRKATLYLLTLVAAALLTLPAQAVIVRGTVTTPFGVPLGNARVQLIQGQQVAAFTFTQMDGSYEVRSA